MKQTPALLILFLTCTIFTSTTSGSSSFPPDVSAAIETKFKNMKVMGAGDIDKNECNTVKGANGVLRGDLNGDGTEDFAMLFGTKESHRKENGDLYRYMLVVFVSGKDKKYQTKVLTDYEDFFPPIIFINIHTPGNIEELGTGKTAIVKHPAIDLTYCGKSAVTYFWKDQKFSEIWTSD